MALGCDQRAGAEGHRGAHDRADIVRVGNLVENDQKPRVAKCGQRPRRQGCRFQQHPLVHGVVTEQPVDFLRADQFERVGQVRILGDFKPQQRIARGLQAGDAARRIVDRGTHGMQSVQMDGVRGDAVRVKRALARRQGAFALRLRRWQALLLPLGVAVGAAQLGVMGIAVGTGRAGVVIFAHGALIRQLRSGAIGTVATGFAGTRGG